MVCPWFALIHQVPGPEVISLSDSFAFPLSPLALPSATPMVVRLGICSVSGRAGICTGTPWIPPSSSGTNKSVKRCLSLVSTTCLTAFKSTPLSLGRRNLMQTNHAQDNESGGRLWASSRKREVESIGVLGFICTHQVVQLHVTVAPDGKAFSLCAMSQNVR